MKIQIKRLICLVFSLGYIISLALFSDWSLGFMAVLNTLLTLSAPLSLIIYILIGERALKIKSQIVPIGFGLRAITVLFVGWSSAALTVYNAIDGTLIYIFFALQAAGVVLMALGTLYSFEYRKLLKWGSIIFIGSAVLSQLFSSILVLGSGGNKINLIALFEFILLLLFHVGILLFSTEKKA